MLRNICLLVWPLFIGCSAFQSNLVWSGFYSSSSLNAIDDSRREAATTLANSRRAFLSSSIFTTATVGILSNSGAADEESFQSIAARAAKIVEDEALQVNTSKETETEPNNSDSRTVYDFELPVAGKNIPFSELIGQEITNENDEVNAKVKAILVVNIKQDDPIARKNIPELISLAAKFGRNGEFAIISCPTDQGYFEADTSELIRLKLDSEYGYGLNPAAILTDKVNLLGTSTHPMWRWMEGTCRTPAGLGSVQGNFEKFLIDGRTGKPIRRYPRQYQPFDITDDINAIMRGKRLPPAGANWREEWRSAAKEAERDTYRFQKGLNWYDQ